MTSPKYQTISRPSSKTHGSHVVSSLQKKQKNGISTLDSQPAEVSTVTTKDGGKKCSSKMDTRNQPSKLSTTTTSWDWSGVIAQNQTEQKSCTKKASPPSKSNMERRPTNEASDDNASETGSTVTWSSTETDSRLQSEPKWQNSAVTEIEQYLHLLKTGSRLQRAKKESNQFTKMCTHGCEEFMISPWCNIENCEYALVEHFEIVSN